MNHRGERGKGGAAVMVAAPPWLAPSRPSLATATATHMQREREKDRETEGSRESEGRTERKRHWGLARHQ